MADLNKIETLRPFRRFCMTLGALPTAYLHSLSYLEMLEWFCEYLEKTVIPTINNNAESVMELQDLFIKLKGFVENYFDNLDVQEEINNKLDEMSSDGILETLLGNYIFSYFIKSYNTIIDLKQDLTLKKGSIIRTLGYNEINDCGGSTYLIIDNNNLVIDNGSLVLLDNNLVAKLIANEINPVIFGAKCNGIEDDSIAIQNAIDYSYNNNKKFTFLNKKYLLKAPLVLKSLTYNSDGAEILIDFNAENTRESLIINDLYFTEKADTIDTIILKNITFIDKNSQYKATFSFKHCTVKMFNCSIFKYHSGSCVDLYGINPSSIIDNCKITIEIEDTTQLASCLMIRGFGDSTKISENILINKCILTQNSSDETLWISSGYTSLKNINVSDCIINDLGPANNTIYAGNNRTGFIKDVNINNCIINKTLLTDRCITLARTQNTDTSIVPHNNFIFSNNIINVYEGSSKNNRILVYCYNNQDYKELLLSNNKFNYNGTIAIESIIEGNVIAYNNIIKANLSNYSYKYPFSVKGDYLESTNGLFDVNLCDSVESHCTNNFLNDSNVTNNNTHNSPKIMNCIIDCNYLLNLNGINGNKYNFNNNIIKTTNDYIINNYNPTNIPTIILENTKIESESGVGFIKNSPVKLYAQNNVNITANEIKEYKGIPVYTTDKESYVVGSVLFANTNGKSLVRKISEGNSAENWEII